MDRRTFLGNSARFLGATSMLGWTGCAGTPPPAPPLFRLSLAQWSLHRSLGRGAPATMTDIEFAGVAARLGFEGIEYVNQFFKDKAKDAAHLAALRRAAADHGVRSLLIMIDGEGHLGDPDTARRRRAVENHFPWVEAARTLGCHAIRVNAASKGTPEEQARLAADGLRQLTEFGAQHDLDVIVENHGGLSSNGAWLSGVIRSVGHRRCGTLPDFGNFGSYDRYRGVRELMPFARAVSAKSHDFDERGNETHTDYLQMMRIVVDAGYHGFVGVEYEGRKLPEIEGILATKRLLERVRTQLTAA
ncbi:MAG: TIM barrel protein [Planctomycetes bacterium]|nr:TIM barrel protein [Planctomycetota bacterium]